MNHTDSEKEETSCSQCGSKESETKFVKDGFRIVRCKACGFHYVNPRLKAEVLKQMYNKNEVSPVPYYKETLKDDTKTFTRRMRLLKRFLNKESVRALDVGCNIGTFMKEMRKEGWDVRGIDLNKSSILECKKEGLKADCMPFEEVKTDNSGYDLIVMNDFIEHIHSPTNAMKKANKLLKDGGMMFITTPDIGSLLARISGKHWVHMKPDEHIHFFSKKTMRRMLEKEGFKVIWMKHVGRVRNLQVVFFKSQSYLKLVWKIVSLLRLDRLLKMISMNINPGDEMGVIAVKIKTQGQ